MSEDQGKVEEKAKRQGWVPTEEYKGDGEPLSAEEFLKKGEEILAIKNERFKKQSEKLELALTEISSMKATFKEFGEYTKSQKELIANRHKAEVEELREKQRAIASDPDGDIKEYDRIGRKIEVAEAAATKKPDESKGESPDFPAFQSANPWYNTDVEMTIYANQVGGILLPKHGSANTEFYNAVATEIKKKFPAKFSTEDTGKSVADVEGATGAAQAKRTGKKGYNDLPKEAKDACDKFVKQGLMTQKDYIKDYVWED